MCFKFYIIVWWLNKLIYKYVSCFFIVVYVDMRWFDLINYVVVLYYVFNVYVFIVSWFFKGVEFVLVVNYGFRFVYEGV